MTEPTRAVTFGSRCKRVVRGPAFLSSAILLLAVFLANAVYLLKIRTNNPIFYHSGLGSPVPGHTGAPYGAGHAPHTIDANDGWTAQALGRLAADMWSGGHVPLWNVYEGLGQPLAGEMQSAGLFLPFILLQLLPNGIFIFHVALELVAGFGTLLFLRKVKLSWVAATVGACLFALNGAFSVMQNAPFNPIAFLPVTLWGVELIHGALRDGRSPRAGMWVTALALAMMLFAGFPETALLEGLFIAAWTGYRIIGLPSDRLRFVAWTVGAALVGAVIAAPVLVAFKHLIDFGFIGYHDGESSSWSYSKPMIATLAMQYLAGPMGKNPVSAGQAGFLTLPAVLMGLVGFAGKRPRALKIIFGAIIVVLVLNMYGNSVANTLLNLIPGMKSILIYKYAVVIIEFAVIMWAAFGIDDLRRSTVRRWAVPIAFVVCLAYVVGGIFYLNHIGRLPHQRWTMLVASATLLACLVAAVAALVANRRGLAAPAAGMAALAVIGVGMGNYMVPQLSASPPRTVDLAPIRFLQEHAGTSRFYTLGPIQPNYGSYFRIAQFNINDLPVPQKMADYITNEIKPDPGAPGAKPTRLAYAPYLLVTRNYDPKTQRNLLLGYGQKQKAYQEAGVKYLVTAPGVVDRESADTLGLTKVFSSPKTDIWQDDHAAPYYTTEAPCTITEQTMTEVALDCQMATTLTRRQVLTPGWTATINGHDVPLVDKPEQLFQTVSVPAGRSKIAYSYLPKYFVPASIASLAVVALLIADGAVGLVRRRRRGRVPAQGLTRGGSA